MRKARDPLGMPTSGEIHLVFGLVPEELGGDGTVLTVLHAEAARKTISAAACRTWGEFAALCGFKWKALERDLGHFLPEANGGVAPTETTPFSFAEFDGATPLLGDAAYWIGRLVPDPREAAIDCLRESVRNWHSELERMGFEIDLGSPVCHIQAIEGRAAEAFEKLPSELKPKAKQRLSIHRDDALVRSALVLELQDSLQ